jgi:hypothetical protein
MNNEPKHVEGPGRDSALDPRFAAPGCVADAVSGGRTAACRAAHTWFPLDHPRAGDIVLISAPTSWQAYYWWFDDAHAPRFARSVAIHSKPGYDPVELHFDPHTRGIPLDATLVRGSHGAPVTDSAQCGVLLGSHAETLPARGIRDVDVAHLVLQQFDAT